jgi:AcrR family transcriptional regulator
LIYVFSASNPENNVTAVMGRKRNPELDDRILDAAIDILASDGFDAMTMDQVAAQAGSTKASVYRRWPSKAELVRDALIRMSSYSVNTEDFPDTGSLKEDLLSIQKSYSKEFAEKKVRVLSGLGSFNSDHRQAREDALSEIFGAMNAINLRLMERAKERGEIAKDADVHLACETIVASIVYQTSVKLLAFDKTQYSKLIDTIILPALKHATL